MKKEFQLIDYLEVDQSCTFNLSFIQKTHHILRMIHSCNKAESQVLKKSLFQVDYFLIQQPLFLEQFFEPFVKGYVATIYKSSNDENEICGMTLQDTLQIRHNSKLPYEESQLIVFLYWLIDILQKLKRSYNVYHGNLHPSNFLVTSQKKLDNKKGLIYFYQVLGFNNLYTETMDNNQQHIHTLRQLKIHNSELLFMSPEFIDKYQQQYETFTFDTQVDFFKNDLYSCGIILIQMMTLGQASDQIMQAIESDISNYPSHKVGNLFQEKIGDFIKQNENAMMNQYPIISTIMKDMLHSQPSRKNLNNIFQLVQSEYDQLSRKQEDLFFEDKIFQKVLVAHIDQKQLNKSNRSEPSLHELSKSYNKQPQVNQREALKIHYTLKKSLDKLSLFFKLKLLHQLDQELKLIISTLYRLYRLDSFDLIFENILSNRKFYFDQLEHSKILIDLLQIYRYLVLFQISKSTSLKQIQQKIFVPELDLLTNFLSSLIKIKDKAPINKIQEITNIQQQLYRNIQQMLKEFQSIQVYCQVLSMNYELALPFLLLNDLKYELTLKNQLQFMQSQMIFSLLIHVQSSHEKDLNETVLKSQENLAKIENLMNSLSLNKIMVKKFQNLVREFKYTNVQLLVKQYKLLQASENWQQEIHLLKKGTDINLCIFDQTNYIKYQTLQAELYWSLDDGINLELCLQEILIITSLWIDSIDIQNSYSHFRPAKINSKNKKTLKEIVQEKKDQIEETIQEVKIYQDFFIYQLVQLDQCLDLLQFSQFSDIFIMKVLVCLHDLEYYKLQEHSKLNHLVLSTLIKCYQIIIQFEGSLHIRLRQQVYHNQKIRNKTNSELYCYYQSELTQLLLKDRLDKQQRYNKDLVSCLVQEAFINYLLLDLSQTEDEKQQIIAFLHIPLNIEQVNHTTYLNVVGGDMDAKFIMGKLMFSMNNIEKAFDYFFNIFNNGKELQLYLKQKNLVDLNGNNQLMLKTLQGLQWSFKCCIILKEFEVSAELLRNAYDMLDYSLPWWQYFFKAIAIDFASSNMTPTAQLISQVAIKILADIKEFEIKDSSRDKDLQSQQTKINDSDSFLLLYTSHLLQEHTNTKEEYLQHSLKAKQFMLIDLTENLQNLNQILVKKIDFQQIQIKQMRSNNYLDDLIKVKEAILKFDTQKYENLHVVQSSLLEEGGDPVKALKFIDETFSSSNIQESQKLLDKIVQKRIKDTISNDEEEFSRTIQKFKISVYKLQLNLFDKCIPQLQRLDQVCQLTVQKLIDEIKKSMNEDSLIDNMQQSQLGIFWRPSTLFYISRGKNIQIQQFTQYKILFYASRFKLLESLCMRGNFNEAQLVHSEIIIYYCSFMKQNRINIDKQQMINNYFIMGMFEYFIGIYYLKTEQYFEAVQYFVQASKNFRLFHSNHYPKDQQEEQKTKKEQFSEKSVKSTPQRFAGMLKDDQIAMKESNRVLYEMQDEFTDPVFELQVLQKLFYFISYQLQCLVYECQAYFGQTYQHSNDIMLTYEILVQTLESIRKIMGRRSVLYADALLVYTKYLMYFKQSGQEELLKIILKTKYFNNNKNAKNSEIFRPGLEFEEYKQDMGVEDKFIFLGQDQIEKQFNPTLLGYWIDELTDELINFYTAYYGEVDIKNHFNLVECHQIKHKLYFHDKKLYYSQISIELSQTMLLEMIPDQSHPLFIHLYLNFGCMIENMKEITEENIQITLKLINFSPQSKLLVVKELLLSNKTLNKFYDEFKANPFDFFLVQKLEKFLQQNTSTKNSNNNYEPITRKQMQGILDLAREQVQKQVKETQEQNSENQQILQESIKFYRKAFMICKRIYVNRNNLFNFVEDKFLIMKSQEDILK